mmetsp:Transcript_7255/g.19907  ORF Transcript_7255/g.19907 Transcript_7255/m.19907 type:complete len:359 (+) Transcript_7255:424-1500(+)
MRCNGFMCLPVGVPEHPSSGVGADDHLANLVVDEDEHGIRHAYEHVQNVEGSGGPYNPERRDVRDQAYEQDHGAEPGIQDPVSQSLGEEAFLPGFADQQIGRAGDDNCRKVCRLPSVQDVLLRFQVGEELDLAVPPVVGSLTGPLALVEHLTSREPVLVSVGLGAILSKEPILFSGEVQGVFAAFVVEGVVEVDNPGVQPAHILVIGCKELRLEVRAQAVPPRARPAAHGLRGFILVATEDVLVPSPESVLGGLDKRVGSSVERSRAPVLAELVLVRRLAVQGGDPVIRVLRLGAAKFTVCRPKTRAADLRPAPERARLPRDAAANHVAPLIPVIVEYGHERKESGTGLNQTDLEVRE